MITAMKKDDVVALGVRNRAGYLLEQYGYTMGLARLDGEALEDLLPAGYLDEVSDAAERVSAAMKDRALAAEESKGSTQKVNDALRQAKEWRRTVAHRAKFAKRSGKNIPDQLIRLSKLTSVPEVAASVNNMIKLLEANAADIPGRGIKEIISEGKELYDQINSIDAAQEIKHLKELPDAVRKFYYEKGLLYIGIKGINDIGRSLHKKDAAAAGKYNMSILYRQAGKRRAAAGA